jgi:hypothetical protein
MQASLEVLKRPQRHGLRKNACFEGARPSAVPIRLAEELRL